MNQYDLHERVAIVTGGASGLGLATARRMLESGALVSLWDLEGPQLDAAVAELGPDRGIQAQVVDISQYEQVERAAAEVESKRGRIDILVNSAGISGPFAPCAEYSLEVWHQQLAVNLTGVFYCCRAVIPAMRRRGYGRIINVSSTAGKEGNPLSSGYSAAKAGVIGLTKSLGKELATAGVIVNCVTPGLVNTPMHQRSLKRMPPELMAQLKAKIPMNRIGEPKEVAAMIAWLASEDCSFTTGSVLDLSGGRTTY